jgi:lysozyme family protein
VALSNFAACDAFTAPAEGGLSMDPNDPGNWTGGRVGAGVLMGTKFGIAAADHPGVNIAALTPAAAQAIRQAEYWTPNGCDGMPSGVDLMLYDEDVNAGNHRSALILQGVLELVQDGSIGPVTLRAVAEISPALLINQMAVAQGVFYRSLALFAQDGHGWLARLEQRRVAAYGMARGALV